MSVTLDEQSAQLNKDSAEQFVSFRCGQEAGRLWLVARLRETEEKTLWAENGVNSTGLTTPPVCASWNTLGTATAGPVWQSLGAVQGI